MQTDAFSAIDKYPIVGNYDSIRDDYWESFSIMLVVIVLYGALIIWIES